MTSTENKDVQRVVVSAVGAIALSTICVLGAVVPAMAASPAQGTIAHHNPNSIILLHPSAR